MYQSVFQKFYAEISLARFKDELFRFFFHPFLSVRSFILDDWYYPSLFSSLPFPSRLSWYSFSFGLLWCWVYRNSRISCVYYWYCVQFQINSCRIFFFFNSDFSILLWNKFHSCLWLSLRMNIPKYVENSFVLVILETKFYLLVIDVSRHRNEISEVYFRPSHRSDNYWKLLRVFNIYSLTELK